MVEYDYTKVIRQPIRVYQWRGKALPLATNGIKGSQIAATGAVLFVVFIIGLVLFSINPKMVMLVVTKGWLLIAASIGVVMWILFSISWDRKNAFTFFYDRIRFKKRQGKALEHGSMVDMPIGTKICYQKGRR
ncbi:TcpE family conjugal transfer membrane protein [Listeria kieliensis]